MEIKRRKGHWHTLKDDAEDEEPARSMHAKLLQNLRAYSGQKSFDKYMQLIDKALPKVFKTVVDEVMTLEDPSSLDNMDHVKDDLWTKEGKVLERFIGLTVQICRSLNASDFLDKLSEANLNAETLVKKLKKVLEVYRSPSTDFPCIRVSTLDLLTWMVEKDGSYREILLQCGVYEELNEVARTAKKLESFKLFHCGVGIPEQSNECISSIATRLKEKLQQSPSFNERVTMDSSAGGEKMNKSRQDLPEKKLNFVLLCSAFLYRVMNGLGTLATIWATVVLLGGFSTLVKKQDFWYITVIAFVQSIGILGGYEDPAYQIFLRAPEALIKNRAVEAFERKMSWWRRRATQEQQPKENKQGKPNRRKQVEEKDTRGPGYQVFLGVAIMAAMQLGKIAAMITCIALSSKRLEKQDYVELNDIGNNEHQNIKWSLNIFYSLVLAQGIICIYILLSPLTHYLVYNVRRKYKLYGPSGRKILYRYKKYNFLEFIKGNVLTTLDMNLLTFSKNLVVSISVDDQLLGIRAMDRILRSVEFRRLALRRLEVSMEPGDLGKLVDLLGFVRTMEEEQDIIRGHAARVVLKLSPYLLVQSCPQIFYIISSSLLSTSNKRVCKCNMDSDLVWFGLRILDKLTDNPENCRKATDDEDGGDILSTVIDLTNMCGHGCSMSNTISDSWIEQEIIPLLQQEHDIPLPLIKRIEQEIIVGMALNILSKLVAAPGKAGNELREETSKSMHFLTNTGLILEHVEATRVISCLAVVDEATRKNIGMLPNVIKNLKKCLVSKTPYVNITKVAAKLLLLEYTSDELLNQIQSFVEENRILEDQSFSLPISAFIQELDLDQPWIQSVVQRLDLEDLLSAPPVNHSEAAAKALILLTTDCTDNVEAFLEAIKEEELDKLVKVLYFEDAEKEKRRVLAHFEGRRNLEPKTLSTVKKILCAEVEEPARSMHAKLLQNLRAYSGLKKFDGHMKVIDEALPMVFKAIVDEVATLEDPSSLDNMGHVKDDLWIKEGKLLESFIGLALQICRSLNGSDFSNKLNDADLSVETFIRKLKKILELYRSPSTDFPCIRVSTLELMTWMVEEDNSYREIFLQCGVYEELNELARTARKLESFKLFHCGVGVPEHGTGCISFLATELQKKLRGSPNFKER
uniref:Uncharacterized protein n=1 Tax=Leersia perrieri TaxID=77586 RepID=A0A0D9WCK8_9ORYZ